MCKVLVVENNPVILKIISNHLRLEGCEVLTATDGLAALNILDKTIPDILFIDLIMPRVSGDQLCGIIRRNNDLKDIFIAIHSATILENKEQIIDIGADACIAKGPKRNLKAHVHHVLKQYKSGIRRSQEILGKEDVFPMEITEELLLVRKHYHAIFNSVAEAVVEMDGSGQIVQANLASVKILRREAHSILSSCLKDYISGPGAEEAIDWIAQTSRSESQKFVSSYENPLKVKNRKILLSMVAVKEDDDFFIIGTLQDISQQKKTEEQLARTLEGFNAVLDTIDYGILFMDSGLKARIVNQAYRDMFQLPEDFTDSLPTMREIFEFNRHRNIFDIPPESYDRLIEEQIEALQQGAIAPIEVKFADKRVFQFQAVVLPDNGRLLTFYDISGLKHTAGKLEKSLEKVSTLANHDPLTGLPNLRQAKEKLTSAITLSKRKGWKTAIMFIDLDGFKKVNDLHGHDFGDKILKQVAQRLVDGLRQTDTVARIGGDEFLVIQSEISQRSATVKVAEKIVRKISEPFLLENNEISIGASIGIAIYPKDGEESQTLIKKADAAMYYSKREGKNCYSFTQN
jgi:diguanylate cyclase (GGDEF)-like protein/PAS domain S-box-containing protein